MPEEDTKPMLTFSKVARKAYLYKNEKKREGSRDPDYKGKIFDLTVKELAGMADEEGNINLFLSGWIEEDQSGTSRVGISVQKGVPQETQEGTPQETAVAAEAAPF